jgi:hypothetical protein
MLLLLAACYISQSDLDDRVVLLNAADDTDGIDSTDTDASASVVITGSIEIPSDLAWEGGTVDVCLAPLRIGEGSVAIAQCMVGGEVVNLPPGVSRPFDLALRLDDVPEAAFYSISPETLPGVSAAPISLLAWSEQGGVDDGAWSVGEVLVGASVEHLVLAVQAPVPEGELFAEGPGFYRLTMDDQGVLTDIFWIGGNDSIDAEVNLLLGAHHEHDLSVVVPATMATGVNPSVALVPTAQYADAKSGSAPAGVLATSSENAGRTFMVSPLGLPERSALFTDRDLGLDFAYWVAMGFYDLDGDGAFDAGEYAGVSSFGTSTRRYVGFLQPNDFHAAFVLHYYATPGYQVFEAQIEGVGAPLPWDSLVLEPDVN